MAMALLQPQQQQQHQQKWFFLDFEDDGGIYEVEVDMVGLCVDPFGFSLPPGHEFKQSVFMVERH